MTQTNDCIPKEFFISQNKIIAIGDTHGNITNLKRLWFKLQKTVNVDEYVIVFLGDFVDRGENVNACLDWLIQLQKSRKPGMTRFIMGNHDYACGLFLGLWEEPKNFSFCETWKDYKFQDELWVDKSGKDQHLKMHLQGRRWGGAQNMSVYSAEETFESYGCQLGDRDGLLKKMPKEHKEFIKQLPWVLVSEHYIFVHGGLLYDVPVKDQLKLLFERDVKLDRVLQLSDRYLFKAPKECSRCVVSGHVRVHQVLFEKNRIMCDTSGGIPYNKLSAVILPQNKVVDSS